MKKVFILLLAAFISILSFGQQFEKPKLDASEFENLKVKVGAGFALQLLPEPKR